MYIKVEMKKLILTLFAAAAVCSGVASTKVIAHRGYWTVPGSAQNSIAALRKADSIGCYGSEFDVWMSKDGGLVVNHDGVFKGHDMESSTFAELTAIKLDNGENLPSLDQYLQAGKKCHTRLILELKAHKDKNRENEAVSKVVEMVKKYGLEDRVEYISFSLNAVKEFIKKAPKGTPVFYLNGELSPKELKDLGCAGFDYHINVVRNQHPDWIEQAHKLGMKVNIWTIDHAGEMLWLVGRNVDFITTNEPLALKYMLKGLNGNACCKGKACHKQGKHHKAKAARK